jgi:hypothetical protein
MNFPLNDSHKQWHTLCHGVATALVLMIGVSAQAQASTILAPVKDNQITRCKGSGYDTNFGGLDSLWIRTGDGNWSNYPEPKTVRSILQFDLGGITTPVLEATLGLYYYQKWSATNGADPPADRTYEVRRLLCDWDEGEGKKRKNQGGPDYTTLGSSWKNHHNDGTPQPWDAASYTHIDDTSSLPEGHTDPPDWYPQAHFGGGDFPYTDYDGADHWGGDEVWAEAEVPEDYGWIEWDVTDLARAWHDGSIENHGLVIRDRDELWHRPPVYDSIYGEFQYGNWHGWGAYFHSKEYEEDESLRPYLKIVVAPPGDANLDGHVDDQDASILAAHWQQPGAWADGDFNGDSVVDDRDASILAAHWQAVAEEGRPAAPVPEPSTWILLAAALTGVASLRRRWRAERD